MSVAEVAAVLGRYDDEAWIALANRGLLRRARKDLDALEVRLTSETREGVEIAVGDRSVRIGVAGPGEARCSCSSAVICQHIISAGLWLASAASEPSDRPDLAPAADRLHHDLMAIDAGTMTSYTGLPGYRWAHQMIDDQATPPSATRDGYLAVTFARPPLTVRYLGGGLDGMVLDQPLPHGPRYRVAAVLAWQRAHDLVLPPPPAPRARAGGESEPSLSRRESRARLRTTVSELLRDMIAIGVSHLSPAIHERLTTTATWAQGVEYYRLALLLRRLADQLDLLLTRSALADDLALLDEIGVAHALVAALGVAGSAGQEPAALVGRARTAYDSVRSLDLIGLCGRPWRTASGYQGLTCVFWSPSRQQFLSWTDARPASLAAFDPRARWRQPAPWTGLATPATLAGCRLALTHAQVSPDNRISGAESTTAALTALGSDELVSLLPVRTSWGVAPARIHGLSDPADPMSQWAVLRPARARPARWDNASQTLQYTLLDDEGEAVTLEVPWSRLHAHVIGRLEALGEDLPTAALVVARVVRRRGHLVGEPLSLVQRGRAVSPVDALHFDDGPPGRRRSPLVKRLLKSNVSDRPVPADDEAPPPAVPVQLADLRALIEAEAQRGCGGMAPGYIRDRLAQAHRALRGAGMSLFAEPVPALSPAEALLRSLYLVQQVERALA